MRDTDQAVLARRVGVRIRAARRASGLSRDQVARSAGLTGRELAGYEHGKTLPCRSDLRALAGACGIDARALVPADLAKLWAERPSSEGATGGILSDDPRPAD